MAPRWAAAGRRQPTRAVSSVWCPHLPTAVTPELASGTAMPQPAPVFITSHPVLQQPPLNAHRKDTSEHWCLCMHQINHPSTPGTPAAPQDDHRLSFNRIMNCVYVSSAAGIGHRRVRLPQQIQILPTRSLACQSHPEPRSLILSPEMHPMCTWARLQSRISTHKEQARLCNHHNPSTWQDFTGTDILSISASNTKHKNNTPSQRLCKHRSSGNG